jgi:hypothetical protein
MYKRIAIYVFITVSFVGCGDDAATRAENEALRARLENLEANQSGGDTHSEQASAQPESALSPEDVARRYFDADIWQDRLPFVAYPDRVKNQMRDHYGDVNFGNSPRYTIHRAQEQGNGKWHIPLSANGVDQGHQVIIKTKDGYKVDWEASISAAQARAKDAQRTYIAKWGLEKAKLEVKVLKVYQFASYAKLDIEVRNRSDAFIDFWGLDGVIYGSSGEYLGKAITNGKNLLAGDTALGSISFGDTNVSTVKSWKFKLSRINVSNESGEIVDATRNFSIIVQ